MSASSDIIIVGGGIIGCSLAERLSREGLSVVLLERGLIGREASWAAAGMLAPQSEMDAPGDYLDFCLGSRRLYPSVIKRIVERTAIDPQYRDEGMLYVALTEEDERCLLERVRWQKQYGLDVQILSAEEVIEREPAVSSACRMAVHFPEDHQVDPRLMTQAYAVAARQQGARLLEYSPVSGLLRSGDRVIGVESVGERYEADQVIVAGGCWSPQVAGAGADLPVYPVQGEVLLVQASRPLFTHTLHSPAIYLVPRLDGRIVVGATENHDAGFDKEVSTRAVGGLLDRALDLAPGLAETRFVDAWAGLRPGTPDRRPIIGPSSVEGLVFCTGHFRNGVLLAPLTSELMCKWLVSGNFPVEFEPFQVDRFRAPEASPHHGVA